MSEFFLFVEAAISLAAVGRLTGFEEVRMEDGSLGKTSRVVCSVPAEFAVQVAQKLAAGKIMKIQVDRARIISKEYQSGKNSSRDGQEDFPGRGEG